MKLSVLLFAAARDIAGAESIELDLPESATISQARGALLGSVPALATRSTLLWAVNNEYASGDRVLHSSDVVACFPPVSGG